MRARSSTLSTDLSCSADVCNRAYVSWPEPAGAAAKPTLQSTTTDAHACKE
jgi:hypothetical protein